MCHFAWWVVSLPLPKECSFAMILSYFCLRLSRLNIRTPKKSTRQSIFLFFSCGAP